MSSRLTTGGSQGSRCCPRNPAASQPDALHPAQQTHGFKAVGHRVEKNVTANNKKPVTEKKVAPTKEADATEGGADAKDAENRDQ
ncbi:hypothetical protein PENNAL_c0020G07593 [Penicillium nalgiovense]|uniref:Uncharacterized protein n=1 Tax=Penicillium nalgiovense TaxID=60175 RepID=A0A1V6YI61_PENNA|nr:hypothetical protein PENNAL_c0020G07593 [Penicillium nalgiovense]